MAAGYTAMSVYIHSVCWRLLCSLSLSLSLLIRPWRHFHLLMLYYSGICIITSSLFGHVCGCHPLPCLQLFRAWYASRHMYEISHSVMVAALSELSQTFLPAYLWLRKQYVYYTTGVYCMKSPDVKTFDPAISEFRITTGSTTLSNSGIRQGSYVSLRHSVMHVNCPFNLCNAYLITYVPYVDTQLVLMGKASKLCVRFFNTPCSLPYTLQALTVLSRTSQRSCICQIHTQLLLPSEK